MKVSMNWMKRLTVLAAAGALAVGCGMGALAEEAHSELYVEAVEGLSEDFLCGVDISSYLAEIESGVVFKDFDGNELDEAGFFELLAESGINCVRIRVWNDPYDEDGNSYGGGHNDLATAIQIGKYATGAGLQVMIDFHYSDFWADPSKQMSPKAWEGYLLSDKADALYEFTYDSMTELLAEGVNVTIVQVGNEITNGMADIGWKQIGPLLISGCDAVKTAAAEAGCEILTAVHYTNPESSAFTDYAKFLDSAGVEYDVFGVSYYPFWHGTTENLTEKLTYIAETYGKQAMVLETSYPYTMEDGDGSGNSISEDTVGLALDYDISVQGQANALRSVIEAVTEVGEAGTGVFWWEPAWIPVQVYDADAEDADEVLAENQELWETYGSGWASSYAGSYDPNDAGVYYGGSSWDNQAMFDFEGNPLESLKVYSYVYTGTDAPLTIVSADDVTLSLSITDELVMPETVSARLINDETFDAPVIWDEAQVTAAAEGGSGEFEVTGTVTVEDAEYTVTCFVEVEQANYIQNPGIEDEDMSMWTIEGNAVDRVTDNNMRSGDYSLKFWAAEKVDFTVWQVIEDLPEGTYTLGAYLQGGDAGDDAVFRLYITVNGETYTADSGVTSWLMWDNPEITGIEVPADAEVTVGVIVDAAAGAWGAWDDFYLYKSDPSVAETYEATDSELVTEYIEDGKLLTLVTYYEMSDGTWKADDHTYQYRLEISGEMDGADTTFVFLSNIEDITFEQAWKASGFSSNMDDYFKEEDAILVAMK